MLIRAKGDLLAMAAAGEFDVVIHGCNCQANMGGGIAAQIAKLYPAAREADQAYVGYCDGTAENCRELMLGTASLAETEDGFTIVNGYTQLHGGSGTFSYAALELVLIKTAARFPGKRIGLPYIGCGIAGADQNKVVDIIELFAIKAARLGNTVTLVEFGG